MRKRIVLKWAVVIMFGTIGVLLVFLVANTVLISKPDTAVKPDYYFTFVCPLSWNNIAGGMADADNDYNVNTKLVGSASLNADGQAKAIMDAIISRPDGIITAGMEDNEKLKSAIDAASEAGIPVVLLDCDLPGTERISYTGADNISLGAMVADKLIENTEGFDKVNVCLIVSNLRSVNQKERVKGFQERISACPNISVEGIIECDSEPLEVQEQYLKFCREHPDITAVCCMEGRSSIAIGYILESFSDENKEIPFVIAVDYSMMEGDYPQDFVYAAIVNQNRRYQGYLAVETLVKYLKGESIEEFQYSEITVYNAGEFDDIVEKDEAYEWSMY